MIIYDTTTRQHSRYFTIPNHFYEELTCIRIHCTHQHIMYIYMLYTKLLNIIYNIINTFLCTNCNVVVMNKFKAQARNDLNIYHTIE